MVSHVKRTGDKKLEGSNCISQVGHFLVMWEEVFQWSSEIKFMTSVNLT